MHIVLVSFLFIVYYLLGGDKGIYNTKVRKKQVIIMGGAIFLFAALRAYTVGTDVEGYYYDMYSLGVGNTLLEWYQNNSFRDPGFFIAIGLMQLISSDPQIMLAVIGALVAFGFSYFTYHEKGSVLLFFMMFIGFRIFSFTMSGLRQAAAMSIIFIAYIQLKNNRNKPFLLLTFLASTFHLSSLIFLLAFPVMKYKKTPVLILGVLAFSFFNILTGGAIAAVMASLFFSNRFDDYIARSQKMVFEGSFTIYIYIMVYLISLLNFKRLRSLDSAFYRVFNVLTIGVFFAILGQTMDNVFRISYYFIFPMYPVFSQALYAITKSRNEAAIYGAFTALLLAMQYIVLGPGAGTEDYRFFWQVNY